MKDQIVMTPAGEEVRVGAMPVLHGMVAIGVVLLFSMNVVAGKIGVMHSPPIFFTVVRFLLVGILLLPFFGLKGANWRMTVAALFMGLHLLFLFLGLHLSEGVGPVIIGAQLMVPFAAVLGALYLGERIGAWRIFGILAALGGVALISFDPIVLRHLDGLGVVLLAAAAQAVASLQMRSLKVTNPFRMQLWIAVVSAPLLILLSAAFERGQAEIAADPPAIVLAALVFTAIAGSILGHGGFFFLIQRHPLAVSTSIVLAVPVIATLLSVIFLDETLTWRIILGGALTLFGVGVVQLRRSSRDAAEEP